MERILLVLIIVLSGLGANASEELVQTTYPKYSAEEHSFGIRLDPLWTLIGGAGAEADVRVSRKVSIGIGGYYIFPHNNDYFYTSTTPTYSYQWSAYEVYVGPTIMLTGDYDHHGLYIAPGIGYSGAKLTQYSSLNLSGELDTPELRLTVGYQWVVKNFRFTTGAGYRAMGSSVVTVKDSSGNTVLTESSGALGGLALDLGVGMVY